MNPTSSPNSEVQSVEVNEVKTARTKSPCALGCLVVFLLLIIVGGFAFWRLRTPPKVAEDFKTLPVEEQKRRREDLQKFEDEVQDVGRRIKSGDKSPFRLVASEERLNTLLQDRIRTDKFPIRQLRVGMGDGVLVVQGNVPYQGIETTVTLNGSVGAKNGEILYTVDSIILGGLFRAPKKWNKKVETQVTENLNRLVKDQNVEITNVSIADKQLVIEGTPR